MGQTGGFFLWEASRARATEH